MVKIGVCFNVWAGDKGFAGWVDGSTHWRRGGGGISRGCVVMRVSNSDKYSKYKR